ncbi:MAG: ParB/RepB/Spo0J family partition protein [Bacilli bacterium]|jgi:ParB family chromosome partitioning protein
MSPSKKLLREDLSSLVKKYASSDVVETMSREYSATISHAVSLSQIIDTQRLKHLRLNEAEIEKTMATLRTQRDVAPIIVRPRGDQYEIVLGRRRYHAAKALGLASIATIVQPFEEAEMMLTIIANLRESREANALTIATLGQALHDEFGYTQAALALVGHVSRATMANMMRLLKLPEKIQRSVTKGELTYGHARALINVAPTVQEAIVASALKHRLSVRQVEQMANLSKTKPLEEAMRLVGQTETGRLVVKKKRLTIAFDSETELQAFIKTLQDQKIL